MIPKKKHKFNFFNTLLLLILYFVGIFISSFFKKYYPLSENSPKSSSSKQLENHIPKLCAKDFTHSKLSSTRDVIFLFGTAFTPGLELAIKSLRSTGCNARVVLLTVPNIILTKSELSKLQKYHIEVYKNCVDPQGRKLIPHMIRYNYELKWLKEHQNEVDRVFHTDAYDVFFQNDPFGEIIHYDDIMFVVEPHFIRSCGWNIHWLEQCYGKAVLDKIMNNFIICSGSIAGSVSEYIKLLELMISQKEWDSCYDESMDQPILNYLLWTGLIDANNIKYRFTGCEAGFMTIKWCVLNDNVKFNEYGQILSPTNTTPPYIHQYTRIDSLSSYLFKACGIQK